MQIATAFTALELMRGQTYPVPDGSMCIYLEPSAGCPAVEIVEGQQERQLELAPKLAGAILDGATDGGYLREVPKGRTLFPGSLLKLERPSLGLVMRAVPGDVPANRTNEAGLGPLLAASTSAPYAMNRDATWSTKAKCILWSGGLDMVMHAVTGAQVNELVLPAMVQDYAATPPFSGYDTLQSALFMGCPGTGVYERPGLVLPWMQAPLSSLAPFGRQVLDLQVRQCTLAEYPGIVETLANDGQYIAVGGTVETSSMAVGASGYVGKYVHVRSLIDCGPGGSRLFGWGDESNLRSMALTASSVAAGYRWKVSAVWRLQRAPSAMGVIHSRSLGSLVGVTATGGQYAGVSIPCLGRKVACSTYASHTASYGASMGVHDRENANDFALQIAAGATNPTRWEGGGKASYTVKLFCNSATSSFFNLGAATVS